jgi:hypothetical protein
LNGDENLHPADKLETALVRASNLLNTIGDLYNPRPETFSGGAAFVAMAVATANGLLAEAQQELESLKYRCDLSILDRQAGEQIAPENASAEYVGEMLPDETEIIEWPSKEVEVEQQPALAEPMVAVQPEDFAQSYLELLRKLTAAEVFAAEHQALSAPGTTPELLPLLRSLREDLQKLHSAA